MSSDPVNLSLGASYPCDGYELRVTQRCLTEDLPRGSTRPFDDLRNHEIIKAFIKRRSDSPDDTREVSPLPAAPKVYRLAYGDRHRGATWHDEAHDVVWLLAYAQHEFKGAGDAFPYFKRLHAEDRLLPTATDYEWLFRDREARLVRIVEQGAQALLQQARDTPGIEVRGVLAGEFGVGVAVEVLETLSETYVCVELRGLSPETLPIVVAAFFPGYSWDQLEHTRTLPTRTLRADELGFRLFSG